MLYASVGFGGGSSYIAILLLAGLAIEEVRLIALICNIIVVLGACINYYRADLIPWKKILPIVLLSMPFAFLGGMIRWNNLQTTRRNHTCCSCFPDNKTCQRKSDSIEKYFHA